MSDDFDREEERRKLEEKFGEEADDRERTERLSELLLKGATMTDRHCPECGDPVFRHEGREFCPSCQREVTTDEAQRATAGQAAAQDPTDSAPAPDTDAEVDAAADGSTIEVDTPGVTDTDDAAADGAAPTEAGTDTAPSTGQAADAPQGNQPPAGEPAGESRAQPQPQPQPRSQPTASESAPSAGGGSGLLPARQHLTRTVNRLAQQAAAEEDPGRKREFLAATREAAEALEAVRDAE